MSAVIPTNIIIRRHRRSTTRTEFLGGVSAASATSAACCSRATSRNSVKNPILALGRLAPALIISNTPLAPTSLRKAISLTVQLWIEGDDEPAHDFAQSTIQAVREMFETGAKEHPELAMRVKSIREKT
jgi:hypothetical protein